VARLGLVVAAVTAGCQGTAHTSLIPYSRTDLTESEPLAAELPGAGQCAWYVDEAGRMRVAMRYESLALFGELTKVVWSMAFELEAPPAGRARLYKVRSNAVRMLYSGGIDHRRLLARWGVVLLTQAGGDRYRGRFQIAAAHQQFTLLTSWRPEGIRAPLMIVWGRFEAVHDETLARSLMADIEAEDWSGLERPTRRRIRRITTRPATTTRATRQD
jgi:pimeloyl-ACP methyl ester carboxylesterase